MTIFETIVLVGRGNAKNILSIRYSNSLPYQMFNVQLQLFRRAFSWDWVISSSVGSEQTSFNKMFCKDCLNSWSKPRKMLCHSWMASKICFSEHIRFLLSIQYKKCILINFQVIALSCRVSLFDVPS